ncbi:hypothetical protein GAYE_PCTG52G1257 [Galdieria yellowstonensis]|uniref:Photosynthesis system II assembly factor Ycf48/Hcf136-like domain-containing protein n=1 Tax=Galdieria yellowstonensis TaxID=3028027 RepID=A0AAV9I6J7_9RHOD|nr:hypothetical protein GAYE_PCTG52G1257 [Galdieria yellowstonensis]
MKGSHQDDDNYSFSSAWIVSFSIPLFKRSLFVVRPSIQRKTCVYCCNSPLSRSAANLAVGPNNKYPRRFVILQLFHLLSAFQLQKVSRVQAATNRSKDDELSSLSQEKKPAWKALNIPSQSLLFDVDMDSSNHGWLVGANGTILETNDGGEHWEPRTFDFLRADEEINYRFESVSFCGEEGWIIGKPPILLHTKNRGKDWERIALSSKLPGEPVLITAIGPNKAELATSAGAIYTTDNGGKNWKAVVRETIDATLNRTTSSGVTGASYYTGSIVSITRDCNGYYLAVSSRGNFYVTWHPGQEYWTPHPRDSSRRIQSMGFVQNDIRKGLWMANNGGFLSFSSPNPKIDEVTSIPFQRVDIRTGGYGILDVAFHPEKNNEVWASVGSGILYKSLDGGKHWEKDPLLDHLGSVLYRIKFVNHSGFILGAKGTSLRYNG